MFSPDGYGISVGESSHHTVNRDVDRFGRSSRKVHFRRTRAQPMRHAAPRFFDVALYLTGSQIRTRGIIKIISQIRLHSEPYARIEWCCRRIVEIDAHRFYIVAAERSSPV